MYDCLVMLGTKAKEGEESKREVGGALPPTADLLLLHASHCSLSHQSPTCSQKMHTEAVPNAHTVCAHT